MRQGLYDARRRSGWSQQRVASACGIDRTTYLRVEAGKTDPSARLLRRLATCLAISMEDALADSADSADAGDGVDSAAG